jgi:hypothetical protein
MNNAIRIFALLVAFAGLISAAFSAPPSRALPTHMSVVASGPGPMLPLPCPNGNTGSCVVSSLPNQ